MSHGSETDVFDPSAPVANDWSAESEVKIEWVCVDKNNCEMCNQPCKACLAKELTHGSAKAFIKILPSQAFILALEKVQDWGEWREIRGWKCSRYRPSTRLLQIHESTALTYRLNSNSSRLFGSTVWAKSSLPPIFSVSSKFLPSDNDFQHPS